MKNTSTESAFLACLFLALTTFALLFTNFPSAGWPGGDGRAYANITEALVEAASFDLRNSTRAKREPNEYHTIVKEDGRLYSVFPMGLALAQAPFLAVSRTVFGDSPSANTRGVADNLSFSFTSALLFGLSGALMFILLRRVLNHSVQLSALGVLLYCYCTLALPFSKSHGVEPLQVVLFMGMVITGLRPGKWSIFVSCLCFGWLVLTKPPSAVALPVFVYLFFHGKQWQRSHWPARGAALVVTVGSAGLFFYYNWLRTGDASAAYGLGRVVDVGFALSRVGETLWPLLFGPERNLFLNNPILLLAIPGLFLLGNRPYLITTLGLWLTMLLLYGASGNTNWGSYVGNARYTVPFLFLLVPLVLAFLGWSFGKLSALWMRWLAAALIGILAAVSLYVQFLYSTYSEFHVKQFESTYNHFAKQYEMPLIPQAKQQLRFAHTLAWSTRSCTYPDKLSYFDYPADDAKTSSFSAIVLKNFEAVWFCKDYLFLNQEWFTDVSWLPRLRWLLIALCAMAWVLGCILFVRLLPPLSRSGPAVSPSP